MTHLDTLYEILQVLESAASHNRSLGRTVFAYYQQDRANRLKSVIECFESTFDKFEKKA